MNKRQRKKANKRVMIRSVCQTPRKRLRNRRRAAWVDETYYMGIVAMRWMKKRVTQRGGRFPTIESLDAELVRQMKTLGGGLTEEPLKSTMDYSYFN